MKVALILASNTKYAPHIFHYIKMLQRENIDYDIIIWNKDNILEENCISYNRVADLSKSRLNRLLSYFGYTKFVASILKKNNYNRVIVFTVFLGVLLAPYLRKNFKKKYYFDIRDFSPILNFFPGIINPIIKNSFSTAISSPGFLKWLPNESNLVISHNYNFANNLIFTRDTNRDKTKYIILTIGFLRDFETNKIVLNSFKNNILFLMKFVGTGIAYEPLINFASLNKVKNVEFTGAYDKKNELEFLTKTTLMNILLADDLNSSTLMTNRLYLAISNGIPVIVNKNSTQGEYVQKYNLGIVIENNDYLTSETIQYLENFDEDKFESGCHQFLSDIKTEQENFELNLKLFFTE